PPRPGDGSDDVSPLFERHDPVPAVQRERVSQVNAEADTDAGDQPVDHRVPRRQGKRLPAVVDEPPGRSVVRAEGRKTHIAVDKGAQVERRRIHGENESHDNSLRASILSRLAASCSLSAGLPARRKATTSSKAALNAWRARAWGWCSVVASS